MSTIKYGQISEVYKDFLQPQPASRSDYSALRSEFSVTDNNVDKGEKSPKSTKSKSAVDNIVVLSVLVAFGIAAAFGRNSPKLAKKLGELSKTLDKSISKNSQANGIKNIAKKGAKKVVDGLNVVANFTAVKDSLVDKISRKLKIGKVNDFFTEKFKNIAKNVVEKNHNKMGVNIDNFHAAAMKEVNSLKNNSKMIKIDGVEKTAGEWSKILKKKLGKLSGIYQNGFGKNARELRIDQMEKAVEGLDNKVYDAIYNSKKTNGIKLFSKEYWAQFNGYMTERMSQGGKNKINEALSGHQSAISKNVGEGLNILKHLNDGKIPESVNNEASKLTLALDKAVKLEGTAFYNKMAEFKVGSVATDLLGLSFPAAAAVYSVASAKDKDKKTSALLKAGIPLAGGVAVSAFGTLHLYAGIKSLSLGMASGLILKTIGDSIDEIRKVYNQKKNNTEKAAGLAAQSL